jgi:hypothetical protein
VAESHSLLDSALQASQSPIPGAPLGAQP